MTTTSATLEELVPVYSSSSAAYAQAYGVFVQRTNQKKEMRATVEHAVRHLTSRGRLLDVGAGDGNFTRSVSSEFRHVVAIEPNPHFAKSLRLLLPRARVQETTLGEAGITVLSDLVLCANVLFHVPDEDWLPSILRMLKWVAPGGTLALFLQSANTDCVKMLREFGVRPGSLLELSDDLRRAAGDAVRFVHRAISANVETRDRDEAYEIAEFMLNMLPPSVPPTRETFQRYVRERFIRPDGTARFSCDLDCILLERIG